MHFDDVALSRMLHAEGVSMAAFVSLLRDEQQHLVRGELERLPAFAESKAVHILDLTRLGAQRVQWLRQHALGTASAQLDRTLQDHAADAPLSLAAWQKLLEATREARRHNDINGTLIAARLSGTQRALNVLFSSANLDGAYAPDGRTVCYRQTQQLAVA